MLASLANLEEVKSKNRTLQSARMPWSTETFQSFHSCSAFFEAANASKTTATTEQTTITAHSLSPKYFVQLAVGCFAFALAALSVQFGPLPVLWEIQIRPRRRAVHVTFTLPQNPKLLFSFRKLQRSRRPPSAIFGDSSTGSHSLLAHSVSKVFTSDFRFPAPRICYTDLP